MTAIESVLWPAMKRLEPESKLSGILVRKPGYHNSRDALPSDDYSVAQFAVDRQGPASEGSAIDWTFPDAQAGDYRTIAKYSKRLMAAGINNDPRTVFMREFFGNTDSDNEVEGWDFTKHRSSTSNKSHLWHIHISVHRKYINVPSAMLAIVAILEGAPVRVVEWQNVKGSLPILQYGDRDSALDLGSDYVVRFQKLRDLTEDGWYGDDTARAVTSLVGGNGRVLDAAVWRKAYALADEKSTAVRR